MKRGFTLIETLVVMAIIGLILSIVLASLSASKQKARDDKRVSDIATLRLVLEQYYDLCNQYPPTISASASTGCPTGQSLGSLIATLPTPPEGGTYTYTAFGTGTLCRSYHISAAMERGGLEILDSDDDIIVPLGDICTGSAPFVSGADPRYDVRSRDY
jgi:prepilin-type N-terminal cleavage/methylation domain-containing protein